MGTGYAFKWNFERLSGRFKCLKVTASPWRPSCAEEFSSEDCVLAEETEGETESQQGSAHQVITPGSSGGLWSRQEFGFYLCPLLCIVGGGWAAWEEFGGVSNANRRQLQKVRGTFQKQLAGSVQVAGWYVLVALSCVRNGLENPALLKTTFNTLNTMVYLLNWS